MSKIAELWAKRIKATIEDVPAQLREEVEKLLAETATISGRSAKKVLKKS